MTLLRFLTLAVILGPIGSAAVAAEAIVSQTIAGASNGSVGDQTLGWRFQLSTPITVMSLGVYDHERDGFAEPHEVGLWTEAGTLLTSGNLVVGASGNLVGDFRYIDVPDVTLPTGNYVIGARFIGQFVDPFSDFNSSLTTAPGITFLGANFSGQPGFHFPSEFRGADGFNYMTSSFQFVAEPSCGALTGIALTLLAALRRRT